ncbi:MULTISPECIES: glycosyltransferase [Gordonia]|uniref:glycosyltransferase n=1 Tax=Gordonia TaxID=2053 RepID=UPI0025804B07|nr:MULTISPECIES: glycosyltransferase [Gordonia]
MRLAIAHDYLTQRGGAEKVVLALAKAFPDAPIYTTLFDADGTYPEFSSMDIRPSFLNHVGPLRRNHRTALLALPPAARSVKIDADVVIASSSGWSHGFQTTGRKIVYCYSPARWLYQTDAYLGDGAGLAKRVTLALMAPSLRRWDRRAAAQCDQYLAISRAVAGRINDVYGLDAAVLPAPVTLTARPDSAMESVREIEPLVREGDSFYLCVSRLLAYKNVDKVLDAFAGSGRKLVVVGRGPERDALVAKNLPNVTFLQDLSDAQMSWLYRHCRAVVAASLEDYGLTPLEGAIYGKPCAVLRWGGFLDTVVEGVTGVYFDNPDPRSIAQAVSSLEEIEWDPRVIANHTSQFSEEMFSSQMRHHVDKLVQYA